MTKHLILAACLVGTACSEMEMRSSEVPAVMGYAEGGDILFIHTEASDPMVAAMLTEMMGSRVFAVPSLAQAPADAVANVYAFENGVEGMGPMGFQVDVFDSLPDTPGYRPLRKLSLVTWADSATPRELKSVDELLEAEAAGELTIEETDIVINMPIVTWPGGGKR